MFSLLSLSFAISRHAHRRSSYSFHYRHFVCSRIARFHTIKLDWSWVRGSFYLCFIFQIICCKQVSIDSIPTPAHVIGGFSCSIDSLRWLVWFSRDWSSGSVCLRLGSSSTTLFVCHVWRYRCSLAFERFDIIVMVVAGGTDVYPDQVSSRLLLLLLRLLCGFNVTILWFFNRISNVSSQMIFSQSNNSGVNAIFYQVRVYFIAS